MTGSRRRQADRRSGRWQDRVLAADLPGPVCGVDEVGRGPLAGPVLAAAVLIPHAEAWEALAPVADDSKTLSARRRAAAEVLIRRHTRWALGAASVAEIDRLNILKASHLAMVRAVRRLGPGVGAALIDGNRLPAGMPVAARCVIKGDATVLAIACASILAKQVRDRLMASLDRRHPGYGWATNAGYPSAAHRAALGQVGISPHHRRSFAPVAQVVYQQTTSSN